MINQLSQLGYLHTQRGRNGGLSLAKAPGDIRIGDVFRSVEANTPIAECFADADNTCPFTNACRLRDALTKAAAAFFSELDDVTLDGLVCGNEALIAMLNPSRCNQDRLSA